MANGTTSVMQPDRTSTRVDVATDVWARIRALAALSGVPMRDIVESALREYADRRGIPDRGSFPSHMTDTGGHTAM